MGVGETVRAGLLTEWSGQASGAGEAQGVKPAGTGRLTWMWTWLACGTGYPTRRRGQFGVGGTEVPSLVPAIQSLRTL